VEAKAFYFSVKADASKIRLEERRKGFSGFIFLGLQCSAWLLATVEEALKEPVKKDFVKSYREDVKALMVRGGGGGNKVGRYLEVAVFAEGGCKGVIWPLKAVKDGDGLGLLVSCGRCLLFQRLGRWFLRPLHQRGYRRGVFRLVVWVGFLHPLRKWFGEKLFLLSSILGCGFQS
jgi:hypothetical protein